MIVCNLGVGTAIMAIRSGRWGLAFGVPKGQGLAGGSLVYLSESK